MSPLTNTAQAVNAAQATDLAPASTSTSRFTRAATRRGARQAGRVAGGVLRWLCLLLLGAGVVLVAFAHPADAAPTATPGPAPSPTGQAHATPRPAASPTPRASAKPKATPRPTTRTTAPTPVATPTPQTSTPVDPSAAPKETGGKGVGGSLMGPDGVDLSHYDMGWDDGAWDNFYRHFWGNLTQLAWTFHRWIVQIGVWFLTWTFKFGFAKMLLAPASAVFNVWQHQVIEPLGLPAFFFFITCVWFGWLMLRGRTAAAVAELATSLVVSALSVFILAHPGQILLGDDGLLGKTRDVSFGVSAMAFGHPEVANQTHPDPSAVIGPMRQAYIDAFVVEPHMILDWGKSLDAPGSNPRCLAAYRVNIKNGPAGNSDGPRTFMALLGCKSEASFNHDPSPERFVGTGMVGFAGLIMTILMMAICGVVCIAQAMFAAAVIRSCVACLFGLLPSGGRGQLWSTLESVLKAAASIVASVLFLTVFLVTIKALLQDNSESLLGRLVAMDLLAVFGFVFRSRLNRAGHRAASRVTQAMAQSRHTGVSAGGGWLKPSAAGAGAGFAAAELWRENRQEMQRTLAPARQLGNKAAGFSAAVGRVARPGTQTATPAAGGAPQTGGAGTGAGRAGGQGTPAAGSRTGGAAGPNGHGPGNGSSGGGSSVGQRLKSELARTKTGRAAILAGKVGARTSKAGWAVTGGAPVTATRGAARVRGVTGGTSSAVRSRLHTAGSSARAYGQEWTRSVGTVTGVSAATRHLQRTSEAVVAVAERRSTAADQLQSRLSAPSRTASSTASSASTSKRRPTGRDFVAAAAKSRRSSS